MRESGVLLGWEKMKIPGYVIVGTALPTANYYVSEVSPNGVIAPTTVTATGFTHVTSDSAGLYAYEARDIASASTSLATHRISSDGTLTETSITPLVAAPPLQSALSKSEDFLLVSTGTTPTLVYVKLGPRRAASSFHTITTSGAADDLSLDPFGRFAMISTFTTAHVISLVELSSSPPLRMYLIVVNCLPLRFHPMGNIYSWKTSPLA